MNKKNLKGKMNRTNSGVGVADINIERYLNVVINEHLFSSKENLLFELEWLFNGINFRDMRVLDIGGGAGVVSFYASYKGATNVVNLEPEAEGSSSETQKTFVKLQRLLDAPNVTIEPSTIQAFKSYDQAFDIIILNNSINHLNENACINLLKDKKSKLHYQMIFSKLSSLSNKRAKLIIREFSPLNAFALLKIRNPFATSIEWHKHQAPEIWAHLLCDSGFVDPIIRWSSFNRLRSIGRDILGNKFWAYFTRSEFCLSMVKKD